MGECWFAYILTEKWLWKFILVEDNAADGCKSVNSKSENSKSEMKLYTFDLYRRRRSAEKRDPE